MAENIETNLDLQLIQARQKYGIGNEGRKIRQETTKFAFDESLLTLCTFGGGFLDEIRMQNCYFEGMPLEGENNFFVRLVKAASDDSQMQKIVPIIEFEFCQPIPFPYFGENCAKIDWKVKREKIIGTLIIQSAKNCRIKFKLICTSSCKEGGNAFNKFVLLRENADKLGLARLKEFVFGWRTQKKKSKLWKKILENTKIDDNSTSNCPSELENEKVENLYVDLPCTSNNDAEVNKPVPTHRKQKPLKVNLAECKVGICVPGQYKCQEHVKRLSAPPTAPKPKPKAKEYVLVNYGPK